MKIECVKEKLKNAVADADRVTGKNISLPVLNNVLFLASEKSVKVRATNLDLGIEIELPAKVVEEGIAAVPGSVVHNLLSNVYDNSVSLELKNGNVFVKTDHSSTLVKSHPHDDFPTLPTVSNGVSFDIPAQKLVSGFRSVLHSAAVSDIKPEISTVCMYTDEKAEGVVFVATDSFRLAEKKVSIKLNSVSIPNLLMPFKNIIEIARLLDSATGSITVSFNENQISFRYDGVYITSRIIDGVFPDYGQILPKEFIAEAIVLKQDLLNALKMGTVFSDKFNQLNVHINPKQKLFEIQTKNDDIGENTVNIDGALSGDTLELSFNHKYITDALSVIPKDSISIRFVGDSKPAVIQGVGDTSFLSLIMPLNK